MNDSKIKIGDIIITTERFEGLPAGSIGTVVDTKEENKYFYNGWYHGYSLAVRVDAISDTSYSDVLHDFGPFGEDQYFLLNSCVVKKYTEKYTTESCSICGEEYPSFIMEKYHEKYVCKNCLKVKSYFTRNNNEMNKEENDTHTIGIEFECIPNSKEDHAEILIENPCVIPTHDGSLPDNGVEYKTPIYHGIKGLDKCLESFEKHSTVDVSCCGTHINVGDKRMSMRDMSYIHSLSPILFNSLLEVMKENPQKTERIFGRNFSSYCEDNSYYRHGSWLNTSNSNRLEWRISRFKNKEQFMRLINIVSTINDILYNEFISKCDKSLGARSETNIKIAENCSRIIKEYYKFL